MKRMLKEKEMAVKLSDYARELHGEGAEEVTQQAVHNKLDNLKAKAREHYKRFQKKTSTGSAVADPGSDEAYDLEAAFQNWANFRVWHSLFGNILGFGPLTSINSASLATPVQPARSSPKRAPPPMHTDDEDDWDSSLIENSGGAPSCSSQISVPSTPQASSTKYDYAPGSHCRTSAKRRVPDDLVGLSDLDEDEDGDLGPAVTPKPAQRKRKRRSTPTGEQSGSGAQASVAHTLIEGFGGIQREQQQSMQTFLSALMTQQQHTQALVQSQMLFLKTLFDKDNHDGKNSEVMYIT